MKRANGAGTIEALPDGRWRVRVTVEGKRRTLKTFATQGLAAAALRAWNDERASGTLIASSTVTVAAFGLAWLDDRELHGSKLRERVRSIHTERSAWARHVVPSDFGAMVVADVTVRDVERFARWLRARKATKTTRRATGAEIVETDRPLSTSSQKHVMRLVRDVFAAAERDRVVDRSPAVGVKVAAGGPRPRDLSDDWLRDSEIAQLLDRTPKPMLRAAYACAVGLALRKADLLSVRVDDVRLDDRWPEPHVRVWVSKIERWHPVPVMPWLAPILSAYVATLPSGAYLFGKSDGSKRPDDYDFDWPEKRQTGTATRPSALHRAGIDRRVRFHDLRGTTATHLALGTWGRVWSLQEIQQMLAHSDQRVTERYVRRATSTLADAARLTPGCPRLPTAISRISTPPEGIEPSTVRLEGPREAERGRVVAIDSGQRVGNRQWFVDAVESGGVPRALLDDVLASGEAHAVVRAVDALRAARGGPHEVQRAIALLDVLGGSRAATAAEGG